MAKRKKPAAVIPSPDPRTTPGNGQEQAEKASPEGVEAQNTAPGDTPAVPKKERPRKYDRALAAEICERLSNGETLSAICRDEHMPARSTVYLWEEEDKELAGQVARARARGFEALAEEALAIAEDGRNDWMERNGRESVGWQLNGEHVQRSKLRIETRLKLLACWDPKRYGQKVEHGGPDGGSIPVSLGIRFVSPDEKKG